MKPTILLCPQCGSTLEFIRALKDGGLIEETVFNRRTYRDERRVRPGSFVACPRCEWAEEVR